MSASYIEGTNNASDSPEYLYIESRSDGAWVEVYTGGAALGIEIDASQLERLRQTLRESA